MRSRVFRKASSFGLIEEAAAGFLVLAVFFGQENPRQFYR